MPRRVVFAAYPGVQGLEIGGPSDVFSLANVLVPRSYELELVAKSAAPVRTGSGFRLVPDSSIGALTGPLDTLVVTGGGGISDAIEDGEFVAWVAQTADRARRVASVCTGAFVLAEAGLLDGRGATTHWAGCAELARRYPAIKVDADALYVRDGRFVTSAGVSAGIDLALALVDEDLGARVALEIARMLVLFVSRPGGQAQYSAEAPVQVAERKPLRELQQWLPEHLDEDLSVPKLARRAFMSPRNFARAFRREIGVTPAAYVEGLRVERARMLLETADLAIEEIARICGFGSVETLRRAFSRRLGVTPSAYRERFRPILRGSADADGQVLAAG